MTREEKIIFLNRYKDLKEDLNKIYDKYGTLDGKLTSVKTPTISDMPKGGYGVSMEDLISDKLELETEMKKIKMLLSKYRKEILGVIRGSKLANQEQSLLELFYINLMPLNSIASVLNLSKDTIKKSFFDAIDRLDI